MPIILLPSQPTETNRRRDASVVAGSNSLSCTALLRGDRPGALDYHQGSAADALPTTRVTWGRLRVHAKNSTVCLAGQPPPRAASHTPRWLLQRARQLRRVKGGRQRVGQVGTYLGRPAVHGRPQQRVAPQRKRMRACGLHPGCVLQCARVRYRSCTRRCCSSHPPPAVRRGGASGSARHTHARSSLSGLRGMRQRQR